MKNPVQNQPSRIRFFCVDVTPGLTNRNQLKGFIAGIFKKEKKQFSTLNYIFCSDEYLLRVNQQYLKHDFYTDIITFDLSETSNSITGEIYISTERVRDNAKQFNSTLRQELHRVIFHGALHLCGYQDKKPDQQKQMRLAEERCLKAYFNEGS
jgi:probable rRNA maturation factor